MCVETTQTFTTCYCTVVRHNICQKHIDHTRTQVDNNPCPSYSIRYVQTACTTTKKETLGHSSTINCPGSATNIYHFAGWGRKKAYQAAFAEFGIDKEAPCWDGELWSTEKHECGMGYAWEGDDEMLWRHLTGPDVHLGKNNLAAKRSSSLPIASSSSSEVKIKKEDGDADSSEFWADNLALERDVQTQIPKIKVEDADADADAGPDAGPDLQGFGATTSSKNDDVEMSY